ncbi:MAG: class F sortase [Thermoflexales bacterium]|nr:class F sortase [Thermoflexales bacterium]
MRQITRRALLRLGAVMVAGHALRAGFARAYEAHALRALTIPKLGLHEAPIVLLPIINGAWDETRLSAQAIGLLETTGRAPLDAFAPVLAAHVTLEGSVRGVFYGLSTLQRGDRVKLRTEDGRLWRYRVISRSLIRAHEVKRIYRPDGTRLLLLTCALWSDLQRRYTHRLLVEAAME